MLAYIPPLLKLYTYAYILQDFENSMEPTIQKRDLKKKKKRREGSVQWSPPCDEMIHATPTQ